MNLLPSDLAESFAIACLFDAVTKWRGISRSRSLSNGRLSFSPGPSYKQQRVQVRIRIMIIVVASTGAHVSHLLTKNVM